MQTCDQKETLGHSQLEIFLNASTIPAQFFHFPEENLEILA